MSKKCEHENFESAVRIGRITSDEEGPVVYYSVEVKVQCADCKEELKFYGNQGYSPNEPMVSADQLTLRAPAFNSGSHEMRSLLSQIPTTKA